MLKALIRRVFRSLENPSQSLSGWRAGPNVLAGVDLDETSCLSHLPVYAAVNRIASDMALLDPQLEDTQADGTRRVASEHAIHRILAVTPDGEITSDRWRQSLFAHVRTWGNSYHEIEYDVATWTVKAVHILNPSRMKVNRTELGAIDYEYHDQRGGVTHLPPWKVLHFAGLGFDGLVGYSPIALARETLGLGKAADLFGASFFGQAARPAGMLKTTKSLSEPAAKRLRSDFEQMYSGVFNTGRIIVGEDGMEFVPISIPPNDAQFIETRKMGIEDVARLFGIPAHKIGGPAPTGSIEEQNIDYLQSTLLGLCNMFEGEVRLKLLSGPAERTLAVGHDFKKLLKANAAARAQYNATAIQWGWATRNRVARDEGYAPYKGGEAPLLPLNMVQIGPDGLPLPNPTPPQPATPTTAAAASSATDLAGLVRSLIDEAREARAIAAQPSTTANDGAALAAVQAIARAELCRALRREAAAIARAAARPNFREQIPTLCEEHRAYLAEAMAPSLAALATVGGMQIDAAALAASWSERSAADLHELEAVTIAAQRPAAVAGLAELWRSRIDTVWHTQAKSAVT